MKGCPTHKDGGVKLVDKHCSIHNSALSLTLLCMHNGLSRSSMKQTCSDAEARKTTLLSQQCIILRLVYNVIIKVVKKQRNNVSMLFCWFIVVMTAGTIYWTFSLKFISTAILLLKKVKMLQMILFLIRYVNNHSKCKGQYFLKIVFYFINITKIMFHLFLIYFPTWFTSRFS